MKDKIYAIRGKQVMLDSDLAELYNIETKTLNQAVKRNILRFPLNYMFRLSEKEFHNLRSQIVTANPNVAKKRFSPYAFTEQGVAMLAGIINSDEAIKISIKVIDAFVEMRHFLSENASFLQKFQQIDQKLLTHDQNFNKIFQAIESKQLTPNQGIYFDGQLYDAHKFIVELIKQAKKDIILIDNYINEDTLTLLSNKKQDVQVKIYTANITNYLVLAKNKFNQQYKNLTITKFNKSHDRFLLIDNTLYLIGASLKDAGKKWFGFFKFEDNAFKDRLCSELNVI